MMRLAWVTYVGNVRDWERTETLQLRDGTLIVGINTWADLTQDEIDELSGDYLLLAGRHGTEALFIVRQDALENAQGERLGIAGEDLSGHRVVTIDENEKYVYAQPASALEYPLWMTVNAALESGDVIGVAKGSVTEPSWTWAPGAELFVGVNGVLVTTPPAGQVVVRYAVALTSNKIFINPQTPIVPAS